MKLLYHIPQAGQTNFYRIRSLRDACQWSSKSEPFTVKKNEPHRFIL